MNYERLYVQFNDLVFDGFDMISDYDGDLSFKGSSTEYSFGHGSYRPFKRNYLFVAERTLSITITLNMKKLPCDFRKYYIRFVNEQLSKPGKLWAVKNNELLWAIAAVEDISENYSRREDQIVYDINFVIPGGIWYKADKQKTFLVPWDICTFMECMDYRTYQPCRGATDDTNCCDICENIAIDEKLDCSCCCEDDLTSDMALCYHLDDLQIYYSCFGRYRIVYDCIAAEKFNKEEHLGQRLCTKDGCESSIIAGQIYSETEIPTEDVTIIIRGNMVNPWITINDNTNIIDGEYDGALIIRSNGDVYFQKSECCKPELLDPSVWTVPAGNTYGWTIYPGTNKVIIRLNTCCQGSACVWVQHEAIAL